jgi:hypothetical protein
MKDRLAIRANASKRPMAAEVIEAIENHLSKPTILERIERIERKMRI